MLKATSLPLSMSSENRMKEVSLQELHYGAAETIPQLRALASLPGNLS